MKNGHSRVGQFGIILVMRAASSFSFATGLDGFYAIKHHSLLEQRLYLV
jgi:hypothetical protein